MSEMSITLRDGVAAFEPGARILGEVHWRMDEPADSIEARLFWYTEGKGTRDNAVVQAVTFHRPAQEETRPLEITLPIEPYSCSGKLVSILWAIELVALPTKENARLPLTMGPGGREIVLGMVKTDAA